MIRRYPRSFTSGLPAFLDATQPPPNAAELSEAERIRGRFLFKGEKQPWMTDVIRAMRLIKGKKRYVEVGTYDKGCLAYVSSLLSPEAVLVDVDIEARPAQTEALQASLKPGQRLRTILGDSTEPSTVDRIRVALDGERVDCIFIDGNHMAAYVWADYGNAWELVSPGGLIFFHDIYWLGDGKGPGASEAMGWIDRQTPVYAVSAEDPVHRYFPDLIRTEPLWGGVGIIQR